MPPTQLALVSWVAWVAWALGFSGGVASFPCTHATRASAGWLVKSGTLCLLTNNAHAPHTTHATPLAGL